MEPVKQGRHLETRRSKDAGFNIFRNNYILLQLLFFRKRILNCKLIAVIDLQAASQNDL